MGSGSLCEVELFNKVGASMMGREVDIYLDLDLTIGNKA